MNIEELINHVMSSDYQGAINFLSAYRLSDL